VLKAPHPVQGKARAGSSDTEAATTTSPCPSPRRAAGGGGALPPYVTRQLELAAANHAAGWPFSRLLRSVSVPVGGGRPGPDRERLSQTTAGGSIDREVSQPVPVIARRRLCTHPADVTVTSRSQLATRMYIYIYMYMPLLLRQRLHGHDKGRTVLLPRRHRTTTTFACWLVTARQVR